MKVPVLTRPDGQKSTTFTMVVVAFGIISVWLVVSMVDKIGPFQIRAFDSAHAMAYFVPVLTAYLGRRQQESSEIKAAGVTPVSVALPESATPPAPLVVATPVTATPATNILVD
jgi:hypothetical protein